MSKADVDKRLYSCRLDACNGDSIAIQGYVDTMMVTVSVNEAFTDTEAIITLTREQAAQLAASIENVTMMMVGYRNWLRDDD